MATSDAKKQFPSSSAACLSSIVGGSLTGLLVIFRDVSFALVYFKASALHPSITLMMVSLLVSSAFSQIVYSYKHSLPGCIACPSSTAVPFQALIAKAIVAVVSPDAAVVTVMTALTLTALAFGGTVLILSYLPHLDILKSAFPQPVLLGFFGVCGIGMLHSAMELITTTPLPQLIYEPDSSGTLLQLGLVLLAGLTNRFSTKVLRHFSVLPLCLLTQLVIFYVVVVCTSDVATLTSAGWMWDSFPALNLEPLDFTLVDWRAISRQWTAIVSLLAMLVLDLLTTLLPVELMTPSKSIIMSNELRLVGASAIVGGACLGSVSYVSLSPTRLNVEAGGKLRISGLVAAATYVIWIFVGPSLTAYVPKFVVGGMLGHLAFGYLLDGFWESRALMSIGEYTIVFCIILYYFATDLAPAIFMGLILCCFSFILRYSQGQTLEFVTTARDSAMSSNRYRSVADQQYIRGTNGIVVARTSCSHLFFGTMAAILSEAEPWVKNGKHQFLLLDLSSLRTIDASALAGFLKLPPSVQAVIVGLSPDLEEQIRRAALPVRIFDDMDEGLEWCEDKLLSVNLVKQHDLQSLLLAPSTNNPKWIPPDIPPLPLPDVAAALRMAFGEDGLRPLSGFFVHVPAKAHEVVFTEGSASEGLYVVASGALQILYGEHRESILGPGELVVDANIKRTFGQVRTPPLEAYEEARCCGRKRPVKAGDVLCETSLFVPHRHMWNLVAQEQSILLLLTRDKLLLAERQYPQATICLQRCLLIRHSSVSRSRHVRSFSNLF